jgi:hypothetical protein
MRNDQVQLTPRMIVVAVLYGAGKSFIIYVFFHLLTVDLVEELPQHATSIYRTALFFAALAFAYWVLWPFYALVVHRRDLG